MEKIMARPEIKKRICKKPECDSFVPKGYCSHEYVVLTVDEYETIRLIDLEDYSREQCANQMGIARTTAQAIYNSARKKIASAFVYGFEIRIEGGSYQECDGKAGCNYCSKNKSYEALSLNKKEINTMRIAVTYEDGNVFQHFGKTQFFKIYDVEDKQIISSSVCSSNGAGHGALAGVLKESDVDVLICGGLGMGAMNALTQQGIKVISGATGNTDDVVQEYLRGTLISTGSNCNHHDHDSNHVCGNHGCH